MQVVEEIDRFKKDHSEKVGMHAEFRDSWIPIESVEALSMVFQLKAQITVCCT